MLIKLGAPDGIGIEAADVDDLVAQFTQKGCNLLLEVKSRVVASNDNAHVSVLHSRFHVAAGHFDQPNAARRRKSAPISK